MCIVPIKTLSYPRRGLSRLGKWNAGKSPYVIVFLGWVLRGEKGYKKDWMSKSLFDLSGRVAVVMGGTTGLGHAIALGLAEAGADVVASSRRTEQVEHTAAEIEARGRRTFRIASDVANRGSVEAMHTTVMAAFGTVYFLVNAAGITFKPRTLDLGEADWQRVLETNLTGTLRACQILACRWPRPGMGASSTSRRYQHL